MLKVLQSVFSFENIASSEDRRISLEDAVAFVTAYADSDFSANFSEAEEESEKAE